MPNASISIDGTEVISKENGIIKSNFDIIIPRHHTTDYGQGGRIFMFVDSNSVKWIVHEFREDGIFWLPSEKSCDIFMIGGGGAGGPSYGNQDTGKGGGGAGGALWRQGYTISNGDYDIIVGKGGNGATAGYWTADTVDKTSSNNGEDTYAFSVIARGGGHGGGSDERAPRQEGGCGGGGGARNNNDWINGASSNQPTFTDWTSYGNSGGNSQGDANYSGGGGGGIGGNGGNDSGAASSSTSQGGLGGAGLDFSSYFGTTVGHFGWFGGGGGGGTYRMSTNTMYQASPNNNGYGGGGFGVSAREGSETEPNVFAADRIHGMNGTGGGGGGSSENHENYYAGGAQNGRGGSGVVLIRYQIG